MPFVSISRCRTKLPPRLKEDAVGRSPSPWPHEDLCRVPPLTLWEASHNLRHIKHNLKSGIQRTGDDGV